MKKAVFCCFYALFSGMQPGSNLTAQAVKVVDVVANDLVFDPFSSRIYVSISIADDANGNSIGVINPQPALATLDTAVFIGTEPNKMAISDNGQCLFVAVNFSSNVRKFNIPALTAEAEFSLGDDPFGSEYFVEDIEIMPGSTENVAISRRNAFFSPQHEGVVLYKNGVKQPVETQIHTGSNAIEFLDENTLFGLNNETSEFGFRKITVETNGLTESWVNGTLIPGYPMPQNFTISKKKAYSTNGRVIDLSGNDAFLLGTFPVVNGPVAVDTLANLVVFLEHDFSTGYSKLIRYNPDSFLFSDEFNIDGIGGYPIGLICFGKGKYAFNTTEKIVIVELGIVKTASPDRLSEIIIWPNPTADFLTLEAIDNQISIIQIVSIDGKTIFQQKPDAGQTRFQIDVNQWPAGFYQLAVFYENGLVRHQSIIRQ